MVVNGLRSKLKTCLVDSIDGR